MDEEVEFELTDEQLEMLEIAMEKGGYKTAEEFFETMLMEHAVGNIPHGLLQAWGRLPAQDQQELDEMILERARNGLGKDAEFMGQLIYRIEVASKKPGDSPT